MISQLISGSRLPVGSSAMIRRGSWTSARAIAVRCCSPPESWFGSWARWAVRPTSARTRSTAGRIRRRGVPVTSSANATFSQTDFGGSSLKSWKTIPILRRTFGHLAAGQPGEVLAVEDDRAVGRDLVADEELDQRRLAGARWPDEEDEVALGDHEVDVSSAVLPFG